MLSSIPRRLTVTNSCFALALLAIFICSALSLAKPAETSTSSAPLTKVFPGKTWDKVASPSDVGWSEAKLAEAQSESKKIGSSAVIVVHNGRIVTEWGDTTHRWKVHSIRKSFLSALYGIPGLAEKIDLNATIGELKIDDNPPALTDVEKTATVQQLLEARSGIYHTAVAETPWMKGRRPQHGSHSPGTFWYYNNWDFNVLGVVFQQKTGMSVFEAFDRYLAKPLEMEDFRLEDGRYEYGPESIHPAYPFRVTARDMARFGLLFARGGKWNDKQIVPAEWVKESTTSYSEATGDDGSVRCGYGYLWWTDYKGLQLENAKLPAGSFSARGSGGHYILVVPAWDLVIVHRMDTDDPTGPRIGSDQFGKLVQLIVDAMPANERKLSATAAK